MNIEECKTPTARFAARLGLSARPVIWSPTRAKPLSLRGGDQWRFENLDQQLVTSWSGGGSVLDTVFR
jgi:hypothetical protein